MVSLPPSHFRLVAAWDTRQLLWNARFLDYPRHHAGRRSFDSRVPTGGAYAVLPFGWPPSSARSRDPAYPAQVVDKEQDDVGLVLRSGEAGRSGRS